jgi:glycosyltransferase involved in cell wall biosynthesis
LSSRGTVLDVSVVIPTRNRPALLRRAIASALEQSRPPLEVIVVIDGPDALTCADLSSFPDNRLRVIALDESAGGAETRNTGVRHAAGKWIAFLDDDDEWLPSKLELQLAAAEKAGACSPIVSGKVLARSSDRTDVWPLYPPAKPYSEYLLVRKRLRYGEGVLQTSTLLAKRELLLRVPFCKGLSKHQDWDWILRATEIPGTSIVFVDQPVSIWRLDDNTRNRVSRQDNWRTSLDWIRAVRHLVTNRAYASFLANIVMRQASAARAWHAVPQVLMEMTREGHPGLLDLALLVLPWLFPPAMVQLFRRLLSQHSPTDKQMVTTEI